MTFSLTSNATEIYNPDPTTTQLHVTGSQQQPTSTEQPEAKTHLLALHSVAWPRQFSTWSTTQLSPKSATWWLRPTSQLTTTQADSSSLSADPVTKFEFWETPTSFTFHTSFFSEDTITPCVIGTIRRSFRCRTDTTVQIRSSQLQRGITSLRSHKRVHNTLCDRTARWISNHADSPPFCLKTSTLSFLYSSSNPTDNPSLFTCSFRFRTIAREIALDTQNYPWRYFAWKKKRSHGAATNVEPRHKSLWNLRREVWSLIGSLCIRSHVKSHEVLHTPSSHLRLESLLPWTWFLTSQSLPLNPFGARPEVP